MVGWHHRLDGREFEQALGVGDGQGCWPAAVHGVAKSQTPLSDRTTTKFLSEFPTTWYTVSAP